MARHPPTEGNDLRPRVVDAKEDVRVNGQSIAGGGGAAITDGDGVDRQIWVIAAGAADPADAGPDDIIFEEQ